MAAGLLLLLVLRVTLVERPFAGRSYAHGAGVALLGALALLTLVSSEWSGAPGRALIEYDRALLYLLAFVVFGAAGFSRLRLRWMARGLALGTFVVCLCALIQRLLPDVWEVAGEPSDERLSWPLTYWNALGLIGSLGIVLCFSLTSDARETRTVRVLAAAALPVLAATLLLTFSRGAMAAGIIGLLAAVLAGRPSALVSGLLVAVPAAAVAIVSAYQAERLASEAPPDAATIAQGHDLALVLAVTAGAAALARAALTLLDDRLLRLRPPAVLRRRGVVPAAVAGVVAAGVVAALLLGAPAEVQRQYDRFVEGDLVTGAVHSRLGQVGNNGRVDQWEVALRAYRSQPLRGQGAGTYALEWDRHRPMPAQVEDGHSLYLEVLAELGIAGLLLVAGAVLLVLGGLLARTRGPDRGAAGALFAAALAWGAHAGIDWDWEMPAVTLWVFAAGGAALAAAAPAATGRGMPRTARVLAALGCLVIATVPVRVLLSEAALAHSRRAFANGDCPTAIDHALDASELLSARAEPLVIIGYCDARLGEPRLAVAAMEKAVARDPRNWETHYGLAVARAAAGLDPRPAARQAQRLSPTEELAAEAVARFDTEDRATWRRRAASARLPTD